MRVACDCSLYSYADGMSTLYPHYALWICPRCNRIPKRQILAHIRLCEECLDSFSSPDRSARKCKACDPSLDTWARQIKLYIEFHERMSRPK
jgi:hypothetical protein